VIDSGEAIVTAQIIARRGNANVVGGPFPEAALDRDSSTDRAVDPGEAQASVLPSLHRSAEGSLPVLRALAGSQANKAPAIGKMSGRFTSMSLPVKHRLVGFRKLLKVVLGADIAAPWRF